MHPIYFVSILFGGGLAAIDYKDLVDPSIQGVPVNLNDTDLVDLEGVDEVDIKPAVIEGLRREGIEVGESAEAFINDPISNSDRFQGDIMVSIDHNDDVRNVTADVAYNAIKDKSRHWPGGVIPYMVSSQYGQHGRKVIALSAAEFGKYTCTKFVPRTTERDYVYIQPLGGCYSNVGKIPGGGAQTLSLAPACLHKVVVVHEMMHAVGFHHEQARYDRDNYIIVQYQNIDRDLWSQYEKEGPEVISFLGTPYDKRSIMHYRGYEFRKQSLRNTNSRTIIAKDGDNTFSNDGGFTSNDILKINKLYGCPNRPIVYPVPAGGTTPVPGVTPRPVPTQGPQPTQGPVVTPETDRPIRQRCEYACAACGVRAGGQALAVVETQTPDKCCTECYNRPYCAAFTWKMTDSKCTLHTVEYEDNLVNDCGKSCWFSVIRLGLPMPPSPNSITSAPVPTTPSTERCEYTCAACGTRAIASGLESMETYSPDMCCSECRKRPECKAYTWTYDSSTCWMHTAAYKDNLRHDCGQNCWFSEL